MTVMKIISLVLGVVNILLATYSLLGFIRLTRFWYQISNLERYKELFLYISVFVASFLGATILMVLMVIN